MQPGAATAPDEDGGQHVVWGPFDLPGLTGGTYKARELGIDNLEDVPVSARRADRRDRPVQGGRARARRDRRCSPTSGSRKQNPFANPYELHAVFDSANRLQERSPVRIAGVNVGKVTKVEPLEDGSGKARVTMEIDDSGLPIKEDAELKVRSRLFLEGNYFVDLHPGRPESAELDSGSTIGPNQTSAPVQYLQVLTALQSETRADLQRLLKEYSSALRGPRGARLQPGDQALGGGLAHDLAGERRLPRPRAARPDPRARRPGARVRRALVERGGAEGASSRA